MGFEPTAPGLGSQCSTTELRPLDYPRLYNSLLAAHRTLRGRLTLASGGPACARTAKPNGRGGVGGPAALPRPAGSGRRGSARRTIGKSGHILPLLSGRHPLPLLEILHVVHEHQIHTSWLTSRVPFSFTTTNGKAENRQATRGGRPGNRSRCGRWRPYRPRSSPHGRPA